MNKVKQIFKTIFILLIFSCNTKSNLVDTKPPFRFIEYDFSLSQTFRYIFSDSIDHFYSKFFMLVITQDEKCLINYNGANIFLDKKATKSENDFLFSNDSISANVIINNLDNERRCEGKVVFNINNQILETNIVGEYHKPARAGHIIVPKQ